MKVRKGICRQDEKVPSEREGGSSSGGGEPIMLIKRGKRETFLICAQKRGDFSSIDEKWEPDPRWGKMGGEGGGEKRRTAKILCGKDGTG